MSELRTTAGPPRPFVTDGCSGGMSLAWRLLLGSLPPWEGDCIRHDRVYWAGGSRGARRRADLTLMIAVTARGWPLLALAMYLGVRLGGHPWLPLPWRWGFGWPWWGRRAPRGYREA